MKRIAYAAGLLAVVLVAPTTLAQEAVAPASGQKTLAATMNVYVFPTAGQSTEQQSTDEASCYGWAAQNTGSDPFQLQKQAEAEQQQAEQAAEGEAAIRQSAEYRPQQSRLGEPSYFGVAGEAVRTTDAGVFDRDLGTDHLGFRVRKFERGLFVVGLCERPLFDERLGALHLRLRDRASRACRLEFGLGRVGIGAEWRAEQESRQHHPQQGLDTDPVHSGRSLCTE